MHFMDTLSFQAYYNPNNIKEYNRWLKKNELPKEKIEAFTYNPLISIIIPVYNVKGEYLRECINSILKQTYTNFEICLVDDCSTKEDTLRTLKEFENKDKRIKIHYRKENGHISKASNDAINYLLENLLD